MSKWEYSIMTGGEPNWQALQDALNEAGRNGWEAFATTPTRAYCKGGYVPEGDGFAQQYLTVLLKRRIP